jgi:hypothetical protein
VAVREAAAPEDCYGLKMLLQGASILLAVLQATAAPGSDAPTGYRKAYFGATKPGAWAKYRMTAGGAPEGFTTYTRLPNEGGHPRLQVRMETKAEGEKKTIYSDCILETDYSFQKDALSFGKAIESVSVWEEGAEAEELDDDELDEMRRTMPDFGPAAKFVATEIVLGKTCDRYRYTQRHTGEPEQIEKGDIWLDETVPFGLVRQAGTARDASGKLLSRFEMNLVDSGTGATAAARTRSRQTAAGPPAKLADAFRDGQIELAVEVLSGSQDGSRLEVRFKNTTEEAIRLTIPAGTTALDVGQPVQTLGLESASTWLFDIEPGETSPAIELSQSGARRAVKGQFVVSNSGGKPLLSGNVIVDAVK